MDVGLGRVSPVSGAQFACFRVVFGVYLAIHFAALVPYGPELFGSAGLVPDPVQNFTHGILPNPLEHPVSDAWIQGFLVALVGLSLAFAVGFQRRLAALLLWYGAACVFNRNNLILNPSLPYVGALLLFAAVIPSGEPGSVDRRVAAKPPEWFMPAGVIAGAWVLLALGYTFSGLDKLIHSPSWRDGSALTHVANLPLARPGPARDLLLGLPDSLRALLTWGSLGLEVLFLPLCAWRRTRGLAWTAMVGMHLGILAVIDFADLTWGMLMVHAFTVDPRWVDAWRRR